MEHLLGYDVKLVIVACNTATALTLEALKASYPVPIFGVIESGVLATAEVGRSGRVLVLATPATVRSEAYPKAFHECGLAVDVVQKACPLLVPLAEEGWYDHPVTVSVIASYLSETRSAQVDTVLLGCTHYPLLEPSFRKALWKEIALAHGGPILAKKVASFLAANQLLRKDRGTGALRLLSTDIISPELPIIRELFPRGNRFEVVDL